MEYNAKLLERLKWKKKLLGIVHTHFSVNHENYYVALKVDVFVVVLFLYHGFNLGVLN